MFIDILPITTEIACEISTSTPLFSNANKILYKYMFRTYSRCYDVNIQQKVKEILYNLTDRPTSSYHDDLFNVLINECYVNFYIDLSIKFCFQHKLFKGNNILKNKI